MTARLCALDGAQLAPGQALCAGCTARLRLDLTDVPALLDELDTAISRRTSMPPASGVVQCARAGCTHGVHETGCVQGVRLDLDVRASDAACALRLCLHGWARVLDEERPGGAHVRVMRDRMLSSAQGQAALLRMALRFVAAADWLPELARELRDAVREGWAAVDRPPDMVVVGRCPGLGCGRTLYGPEGAGRVRCAGCGGGYDTVQVRADSLAESRTLVTAAQLATALGLDDPAHPDRGAARVRQWVRRKRLVAVRCDLGGRPLYRVADGQALLAQGDVDQLVPSTPTLEV